MVDAKFDLVLRPISHGNPAMPFHKINTALRKKVGCPIPFVRLYPGRKLEI